MNSARFRAEEAPMEPQAIERRLTTILSADVAGYSRLMGEDEAATLAALKAHRKSLIDPKVEQYHGRTIKRSEEHTSELQSLMRISYAVFCLKKKIKHTTHDH